MSDAPEERLPSTPELVLSTVHVMLELGFRSTGLTGEPDARDLKQTEIAVETIRALLPVVERIAPQAMPQYRQALSELQLAYAEAMKPPPEPGREPPAAEQGKPQPDVPVAERPKIWTPRGDV
jgi:hypothetical protein